MRLAYPENLCQPGRWPMPRVTELVRRRAVRPTGSIPHPDGHAMGRIRAHCRIEGCLVHRNYDDCWYGDMGVVRPVGGSLLLNRPVSRCHDPGASRQLPRSGCRRVRRGDRVGRHHQRIGRPRTQEPAPPYRIGFTDRLQRKHMRRIPGQHVAPRGKYRSRVWHAMATAAVADGAGQTVLATSPGY